MAANLEIQDGTPIWLSASIVPSTDTVVSPSSSPALATIHVTSNNVFTYVNVKNIGTVDLGGCSCPTGAWPGISFFPGFFANAGGSTSQSQGGLTFSATPAGDSINGGGISKSFGLSASGRRAWAWSPDGRFFAYVGSPSGNDWFLTIIALQNITLANGTVISKGAVAASSNGIFAGPPFWTSTNFGWAGSSGVVASGKYSGGSGIVRSLTCPLATAATKTFGELIPDFPGQVDWVYLVSPCGSVVAFVPKILNSASFTNMFLVSTTTPATPLPIKKSNVVVSVQMVGPAPSINTMAHTANGVQINLGNGTIFLVDDPDCTFTGGGITVMVDRVKASTLPSANLGVLPVGNGKLGQLAVGKNMWVQVPNTSSSGWGNQSEPHWCLLAQAYTDDLSTIPRPWNGQAASPPAFPISKTNCAQRNIQILP